MIYKIYNKKIFLNKYINYTNITIIIFIKIVLLYYHKILMKSDGKPNFFLNQTVIFILIIQKYNARNKINVRALLFHSSKFYLSKLLYFHTIHIN